MSRDRSGASLGRRVTGVDAARGVALLAMMAVHLLPRGPLEDPSLAFDVAAGRASAAFAVLAGVSIALSTGGTTPVRGRTWAAAAAGLLVRCLLIGLLGLLLGEADSGLAIILVYYALLFALACPLLGLGARSLAGIAVAVAVVVPVWSHLVRDGLEPLRGANPTLGLLFTDPVQLLAELAITGYYPALAWTAYLAAGLAVGRLDLMSRRVAIGLLVLGTALALAASAVSSLLVGLAIEDRDLRAGAEQEPRFGVTPPLSGWWLAVAEPHSGTPSDLAATTGSALALLGLLLLVARRFERALLPLTWVGGMTLTLYSVHVIVVAEGWGPQDPYALYAMHVVVVLALAAGWRSWSTRGPLEQLVSWPSRGAARAVLESAEHGRR